jgi:hypothetical protein
MQMEAEVEEAIRNRGKTVKKKGKAAVKGKGKAPLMMELPTNATRDQMLMQKVSLWALLPFRLSFQPDTFFLQSLLVCCPYWRENIVRQAS